MPWHPPDPPLRAGDLRLRPFTTDDADAVAAACTDDAIVRFTFMEQGLTAEGARRWIDRSNEWWPHGHPRFAVVPDQDDGHLLGQVGIAVNEHHRSAEAYYWTVPGERRRGIAATGLGVVADWAFDCGIERLFLLVHLENAASNNLAARLGFVREGVLRAYEPFKGQRPDLVSWSLLTSDPRPWRSTSEG